MEEVGITDNGAISAFKDIIATLQQQLATANAKLDAMQGSVDSCRDSVAALHTTIVESASWWNILIGTPYGVAVVAIIALFLGYVGIKKGISLKKGDTAISIGKKGEEDA